MTLPITHQPGCPRSYGPHSDPAKRIYDTYHLHRIAGLDASLGKWFASKLSDGTTDNVLYDSKTEAVNHQHHNEEYFVFTQVTMANMSQCDAEIWLGVARRMREKGIRMHDPREVIKRATREDQSALISGKAVNLMWPGEQGSN
jgi:hypothetical protein